MTKDQLYDQGLALLSRFCQANRIEEPKVERLESVDQLYQLATCAFYRPPDSIRIMVDKCATVGLSGACWSFPGWKVDRTPVGVVTHELGHHCDYWLTEKLGQMPFNRLVYSGEKPLSGYLGTDDKESTFYSEWFAEMFRLFVTNPDLLRELKPKTYANLCRYLLPVETRPWREVLAGAPARTLAQAEKLVSGFTVSMSVPKSFRLPT